MGGLVRLAASWPRVRLRVAPPAGAVSARHLGPWSGLDRVADRVAVRQVGDEAEVCCGVGGEEPERVQGRQSVGVNAQLVPPSGSNWPRRRPGS
jgi:hypothetical protein